MNQRRRSSSPPLRAGNWAALTDLVDDDMLNTFAAVGTPKEVAAKIVERYRGKADRVSPVAYQPDVALLETLRREIAAAL